MDCFRRERGFDGRRAAQHLSQRLQDASRGVAEQEKLRAKVLRELLFARADTEPEFRKALVNNPEKTINEVAKGIGATATPELVQEAKERYSSAIFGATDQEVKDLVFGTLDNVRTSFKRTLSLSQALFWVGLTVVAFVATLLQSPHQKGWIAGIFGGGGI